MIDLSLGVIEKKFGRFLKAGVVNTIFGISVYSVCIFFDIVVWLALFISMIFGIAFNFLTFGSYAFRALSFGRLPRFVMCYLFIYVINLISLIVISIWLNNKILSQIIISIPLALVSYYFMNRFVFCKKH